MAQTLLWLDNAQSPFTGDLLELFNPIEKNAAVVWVHNYDEFEQWIIANGLPDGICFDYDLGDDKSGFDCARFLVRYCMNYALPLPKYAFHSVDRFGQESMNITFERYKRFYQSINPQLTGSQLLADGFDNELPF